MSRRLIYLIGGPGSGKSTLMRRIIDLEGRGWTRATVPASSGAPAREWYVDSLAGLRAVELGRNRAQFSGTDALPAAVIDVAEPWIRRQDECDCVLGEGARLANRRFLSAAADSGYEVTLVHLDHEEADEWRAARSAEIGRVQAATWVKGRVTASRRLAAEPPAGVRVLSGHPNDLAPIVWRLL